MRKKLNKILAFLDTADGSLFSRFYNPEYAPTDDDVDEGIKRIHGLIETMSRFGLCLARFNKEADWLADRLAHNCTGGYGSCAACWLSEDRKGIDCSDMTRDKWREVARKAVSS